MTEEVIIKKPVRYFFVSLNYDIPVVHPPEQLKRFKGYYKLMNKPHIVAYFLRKYVPIGTNLVEVSIEEYDANTKAEIFSRTDLS